MTYRQRYERRYSLRRIPMHRRVWMFTKLFIGLTFSKHEGSWIGPVLAWSIAVRLFPPLYACPDLESVNLTPKGTSK